jgi:hypothetical protein
MEAIVSRTLLFIVMPCLKPNVHDEISTDN